MTRNPSVLLIGFFLINSGCTLAVSVPCNLSDEICECSNDLRTRISNRRMASSAWKSYQEIDGRLKCSADFALGFKEGYVSCLEANGNSVPPSFPPRHYGREFYRAHWDPRAIDDWYAGFSSGVAMAQMNNNHEPILGSSQVLENAPQLPLTGPAPDKPSPRIEKHGSPYASYPQ